jgi:two-component system, sporulation sensor kinase B
LPFQFYTFLAFFLLGSTLLFVRSKNKINFWYAGFLFSIGLGLLAFTIDQHPEVDAVVQVMPYQLLARTLSFMSYNLSPYFLLLSGLSVSELIPVIKQKRVFALLTLPILIVILYSLLDLKDSFIHAYLDYSHIFWFVTVWGFSYTLMANVFCIHAIFMENSPKLKLQKILIAIATLPSIFITYEAYVVPITKGPYNFTWFTGGFGAFLIIAFVFFAINWGIMGIKVSFEKDYLGSTMKAITSGTLILNHAIKNEMQNIDIAVKNLKRSMPQEQASNMLQVIENSVDRLNKFTMQIQETTQPIVMIKDQCIITKCIDESIESLKLLFEQQNIKIQRDYSIKSVISCDKIHMQEVFVNLFKNAMEAMPKGGTISVKVYQSRKCVKIEVSDTGVGISKANLSHVIEPFFSTNRFGSNYGLGLSYCYSVLIKHKGTIAILSEENKGTTVLITLPG